MFVSFQDDNILDSEQVEGVLGWNNFGKQRWIAWDGQTMRKTIHDSGGTSHLRGRIPVGGRGGNGCDLLRSRHQGLCAHAERRCLLTDPPRMQLIQSPETAAALFGRFSLFSCEGWMTVALLRVKDWGTEKVSALKQKCD